MSLSNLYAFATQSRESLVCSHKISQNHESFGEIMELVAEKGGRRNLELAPVEDATLYHLKRLLGLSQAVQDLRTIRIHKIRQQFPSNSHKTPLYAKWGLQACYVQKFLHNLQMV